MAGALTGPGLTRVKGYHRLNSEDADDVGPGAYTLAGSALFSSTAQFGNALSCPGSGDALDSDSGEAGIDNSDTVKTFVHLNWRTNTKAGVQMVFNLINAAKSSAMLRCIWDGGVGRLLLQWRRSTDIPGFPGKTVIEPEATGIVGLIVVDAYQTLGFYIDANDPTEGQCYLNGVDKTTQINKTIIGFMTNFATPFLRYGNDHTGLAPARFTDDLIVLQDPNFSDAIVQAFVDEYDDTEAFGHSPKFESLVA